MRAFGAAPLRTPLSALVAMALVGCGRDGAGPGAPAAPTPVAVPPEPAPSAAPPDTLDPEAPFPGDPDFEPQPLPADPPPVDEPPTSPTPMDAPRPGSLSRAGREAYEVARRAGKPLLAVLAPAGSRARRERAGVLGALLRRPESLPMLALVVVACVPGTDASALGVPPGLDATPFAVLVETDGREPRGVALPLPLCLRRAVRDGLLDDPQALAEAAEDRGPPLRAPPFENAAARLVAARARSLVALARLASALEAAVVGTQMPRRVAAAVAVVSPTRAESLAAAVRRGIGLAPEVVDEAAAVIRAAGDAAPDRRAFADRLLAAAAGRRLLEQPPSGARWGGEPEPFGDGSWCGTPFADEPPVAPRLHILPPVP